MSFERELQVAREAAQAAARLCEEVRSEMVSEDTFTKKDRSPVTVADFGAQALICRRLHDEFPNDPVVGEEDSATLRAPEGADGLAKVVSFVGRQIDGATADDVCGWIDHGNGEVADRYWTLDPIDGTKGFVRGDQYAVALALIENGDVKVGILACPYYPVDPSQPDGERGMLFTAVRGQGAHSETLRGGESKKISVAESGGANHRMVESVESGHGDHSLQGQIAHNVGIAQDSLRMDSQAKYGAVASGQATLYLRLPSPRTPDYRENIWDHAAGTIVVEEAGGRVTDVNGKPLEWHRGARMIDNRGVVVSNGDLQDAALERLSGIF